MEKYLHVSFMVEQRHLYDLLHSLEDHKVGNVEVRPVSRILNGNAEADPPRFKRRSPTYTTKTIKTKAGVVRTLGVRERVREAIKLNEPFRYWELANQLQLNHKSVATTMSHFLREGHLRKVSPGVYMLIKEFD